MPQTAIQTFVTAGTSDLATYLQQTAQSYPVNYVYTVQDFVDILNNYINTNQVPFLELSTVRPDFESIKQQFAAILTQRDAWKDIITASGGGTVVDFIASVGAYGQAGIMTALQETNLDTAVLQSSINLIMRMLGVHITRKTPAQIDVVLTNSLLTQAFVVPSLTQFALGSGAASISSGLIYCYNIEPIVFETGETTKTLTLWQGTVNAYPILSTGYPFQRFEIGNNDYAISDNHVFCWQPDGTEYKRTIEGLWKFNANDLCFFENTTPEGNIEVIMGNDLYGKLPPLNNVLAFVYTETLGSSVNGTTNGSGGKIVSFCGYVPDRIVFPSTNDTAIYQNSIINAISVQTVSSFYLGDDERDSEFYRAVGPFIGSGKKGMVRKIEHYAQALQFPGIIDVLFQNQRDIDPYNRNLINVAWVTPLMKNGEPMTQKQWLKFLDYLAEREIWRQEFILVQPEAVELDIAANLYCSRDSDRNSVEQFAKYNVSQLYGLRRGSLGNSFVQSDLEDQLKLELQNAKVDYTEINQPSSKSISLKPIQYFVLNSLKLDVELSKRDYKSFVSFASQSYTISKT